VRSKGAIFSEETFRFFRELSRNNRKEWMDANRDRYRADVVEPLRALLDRLTPVVQKLYPGFDISGRTGRNFSRINRDIRFAADKRPYRTQLYLTFFDQQADAWEDGQLYVGISADAVTAGFRIYSGGRQSRLALIALPRAAQSGKWLEQQARRLGGKYESYWHVLELGEWNRRDGWPTQPDQWKRLKGWIVRRKMTPAAATRKGFVAEVSKIFREVFPLYRFVSLPSRKA
jgi:uncharacterized protein (TIGR02453 family)